MPETSSKAPSVLCHPDDAELLRKWQADWRLFIRQALRLNLDPDQEAIVQSVQHNPRTVVRSGHARGKDYVAAACSLAFLYLHHPSKVINTAPTHRQVSAIMLAEAKKMWRNALFPLGGRFLSNGLFFEDPDWFLLGFRARDRDVESWTGFHSPHIMVTVTEASGIEDDTFNAIEGLLTGDSRLLMVLNPNRTTGEAYRAFQSPQYAKFTLSCLTAPNVQARRVLIPGQVDWQWVDTLIHKPGWVQPLSAEEANPDDGDFEWDHQDGTGPRWYRPGDLFRVKVLGMWPTEPEDQLIPLSWVEAAHERWKAKPKPDGPLRLGVDVAGMGADLTVFCRRRGMVVTGFATYARADHMTTVGRIVAELRAHEGATALVDTIGEGAGVHSRLIEQGAKSVSVKFSESAKHLRDLTGQRTFSNMRAYCYWAVRDALDPRLGATLALPELDELTQDLTGIRWSINSQGHIVLEPKEQIRERLGRSPDYGDALANTYHPDAPRTTYQEGAFDGVGVF